MTNSSKVLKMIELDGPQMIKYMNAKKSIGHRCYIFPKGL